MISKEELRFFKIQVSQMGIGEQFSVCEKHCLLFSLNSNCAVFELLPHKSRKKKKRRSKEFKSNSWSFWYSCHILPKCQVLKCR